MKKYQILSAVVLAMAMTACVHEDNFSTVKIADGDFAFSLSKIVTKSSAGEAEASHAFKLGDTGYYLEESVTSLDEQAVATKGTPIYTENIEKYYPTINVVGYKAGGSAAFVPEASFAYYATNGDRKVYSHHYASDPWPADGEEQTLWFFLKTPQDYLNTTASNFEYGTSDGSIEFDYTSPTRGTDQKDILFTSRTLTKDEYFNSPNYHSQGGAPVTFYHALTAVKFRMENDNQGTTKTIITQVEFQGLKSSGHCKVTPTEGLVSKENVAWEMLDDAATFTQTFENTAYSPDPNVDNTIDLPSSGFGSSWTSAASDKNLNDADGALTFWFIPQTISEDLVLKVTFRVKTSDTPEGQEIVHTIKMGEVLDGVEWKAGQLRTYTLKPNDVDVEIFDTMQGLKKSNLHVTNTGNVDEYVRIMLVGNWHDKDENILVGYKTDGSDGDDTMFTPWSREDDIYKQYFDDTFKDGMPAGGNPWIFGTGSYFYYPEIIGAGDNLAETVALFKSYDLTGYYNTYGAPTIYVPSSTSNVRVPAEGVHLVMEVVIQAIGTVNPETNEEFADWKAAWSYATGKDIQPK